MQRSTCLDCPKAVIDGIPQKGMPAQGLAPDEIVSVQAFLQYLGEHSTEVRDCFRIAERGSSASFLDLPWFEYSR